MDQVLRYPNGDERLEVFDLLLVAICFSQSATLEYSCYLRSTVTRYAEQEPSPHWWINLVEIPTGIIHQDSSR